MMRRVLLASVLALLFAGLGALAGTAVHWKVIQPSDAELLAAAREVTPSGFSATDMLGVSGQWAPSFDRGSVHWDAHSEEAFDSEAVDPAAALTSDGWQVEEVVRTGTMVEVDASRSGMLVSIRVRSAPDDGIEASISLTRSGQAPGLSLVVAAGALLGAVGGAVLGSRLGRRRP